MKDIIFGSSIYIFGYNAIAQMFKMFASAEEWADYRWYVLLVCVGIFIGGMLYNRGTRKLNG